MLTVMNKITLPYEPKYEEELRGDKWFQTQMSLRANYILLGDSDPDLHVRKLSTRKQKILDNSIKWINNGEVIAGSYVAGALVHGSFVSWSDIDIYFKDRQDADHFCRLNGMIPLSTSNIAYYVETSKSKYNLIFGVKYDSPADLIYHFDIRACSMAFDPNKHMMHWVKGAADDLGCQQIVYNPSPHNTTIARLIKYSQKGFFIEAEQRVFLLELIRSDAVDAELELSSGYRPTW